MTRLFTLALASICFLGVSCANMKKKDECKACTATKGKAAAADSCCATPAKGAAAKKTHKH